MILDPYGMTFDAVVVFTLELDFLLKSSSAYCDSIQETWVLAMQSTNVVCTYMAKP